MTPTLFLHVDSEALVEPAGLALVPPDHVHNTPAIVLAEIVQSPERGETDITTEPGLSTQLYPPCRQPPDTSLKESSAAVTRRNSVMFPTGLVSAHLTRDVRLPVKRGQELGIKQISTTSSEAAKGEMRGEE